MVQVLATVLMLTGVVVTHRPVVHVVMAMIVKIPTMMIAMLIVFSVNRVQQFLVVACVIQRIVMMVGKTTIVKNLLLLRQ
tara:strand:- start:622 stop:861 length:240 start_codon:yes stop_codon:yes gene_type:complete